MESETIYALMITGKDPHHIPLALLSIQSFLSQTYPNKCLIIVNDGAFSFNDLNSELIVEIKLEQKKILGALRNIALSHIPENALCIQWDDDDWHHPDLLQKQYAHLVQTDADMNYLTRQVRYDLKTNAAWVARQQLEGTVLFRKKAEILYPDLSRGEDTEFFNRYQQKFPVAGFENTAHYYIRFFHGFNTTLKEHLTIHPPGIWNVSPEAKKYLIEILQKYA